MVRRFAAVLAALVACTRSPDPAPQPAPSGPPLRLSRIERAAADRVTAPSILAPIRFLADDTLEGRLPGSRGSDLAIRYVASEMEALSLEPGGDAGTFLQKVPLVGVTPDLPKSIAFAGAGDASLGLGVGVDVTVRPAHQKTATQLDAPDVVFAGYGIVAPRFAWDDYKDADVRGKIVMLMNDDPADDPNAFGGKARTWFGRWDYKYAEAARHGAAGAIIIHTTQSAGYPWQVVTSSWSAGEKFQLPAGDEPRLVATMWATEDASRKIAALGGKDLDALRAAAGKRDFRPVPLGVRTSISFGSRVRTVESANVVGVLRGRDAKLAGEAVVVSAHHDHLGVGPAKSGDAIYNGAMDNASGVASMLAIARALSASTPRPRRSVVFLAVTAEEQGLLGSEWFCRHPSFAPDRIAADVNIDGINVLGKATDYNLVTMGHSSLDAIVESIAGAQGRTVHPDDHADWGGFYRSDQFSFARIGVPGIYGSGGPTLEGHPPEWGRARREEWVRTHYHQPSDEVDPAWDLAGAVDDVRLDLVAVMRIANADAMPTWNAGDEFAPLRNPQPARAIGSP